MNDIQKAKIEVLNELYKWLKTAYVDDDKSPRFKFFVNPFWKIKELTKQIMGENK